MKKIFVTLCSVALACAANAAATYTWSNESYVEAYAAKDAKPGDANVAWYKCYAMSQATAKSLLSSDTAVNAAQVSEWLGADFSTRIGNVANVAQDPLTAAMWSSSDEQYKFSYSSPSGDTPNLANAIGVFVFNNGADVAYKVINQKSKTTALFAFDDADKGIEWSAVPEPTSGMLLLFGLAGLALKRKRLH